MRKKTWMYLPGLLILSLAMHINPGGVSKVVCSKKGTCPTGETSGTHTMLWTSSFAGTTPIDTSDTIRMRDQLREGFQTLYESSNLSGHTVVLECNPGGTTVCPCMSRDVALISYQEYGEVISNLRRRHTYVNAIGMKKFVETDARGDSLSPGIYRYSGEFRLPVIPAPDINQTYNPQAVHLMIQFWDGRNKFSSADDSTFEGTICWDLNPWTSDQGKVKIYVAPHNLVETGVLLPIDADWHRFELVVNLETQSYLSLTIDDHNRSLDSLRLARVHHPEWADDISLTITTESLAAYPGDNCEHVFSWRMHFKALKFEKWTEQPCLLGDVTLDGNITRDDAESAFHIYLNGGQIPPAVLYDSGCALEAADVNCATDGVTPGDALYIYEASVIPQQPPLICNASTFSKSSGDVKLNVSRSDDARVHLKMTLSDGRGVKAFGAKVDFPSDMLSFVSVHSSDLTAGWEFIDGGEIQPGLLIVGGFDGMGVRTKDPGGLMEAVFQVNDGMDGVVEFTAHHFVDDLEGSSVNPVSFTILPTRVEKISSTHTPAIFALEQNYPNPFNQGTDIRYQLAEATEVNLSIYNAVGQWITTLVSGVQEAGRYIARWEGQDACGATVSSGIYLCRLTTVGFSDVKKMAVIQ